MDAPPGVSRASPGPPDARGGQKPPVPQDQAVPHIAAELAAEPAPTNALELAQKLAGAAHPAVNIYAHVRLIGNYAVSILGRYPNLDVLRHYASEPTSTLSGSVMKKKSGLPHTATRFRNTQFQLLADTVLSTFLGVNWKLTLITRQEPRWPPAQQAGQE